jgi:hypothetical protein
MCPICIATASMTWIVAGAASTGALAALVMGGIRRRAKRSNSR